MKWTVPFVVAVIAWGCGGRSDEKATDEVVGDTVAPAVGDTGSAGTAGIGAGDGATDRPADSDTETGDPPTDAAASSDQDTAQDAGTAAPDSGDDTADTASDGALDTGTAQEAATETGADTDVDTNGEEDTGSAQVDRCSLPAGQDPPASIYGDGDAAPKMGWEGPQYLNVVFKTVEGQDVVLDIFLPENTTGEPTPVMLYTHGGGWAAGTYDMNGWRKRVALDLLAAGVAVVSVDYRLAGDGVVMQDIVTDAKDALRFVTKYAAWYHIDPHKVVTFGDSAGAHVAMMTGLAGNDDPAFLGAEELRECNDFEVVGIAAWYGPTSFRSVDIDFWSYEGGSRSLRSFNARIYTGDDEDELEAARALVSPIVYYTLESPPLYLAHGNLDTTIPYGHLVGMREHAQALGITTFSATTAWGAGHNFSGDSVSPDASYIYAETVSKLLGFLGM